MSCVQLLSLVELFVATQMQCTRLLCPPLSPGVCSNSCPVSQWDHPTIILCHSLFLLPSIFPVSGSFPTSWLFASGGQSIGASASATVLPVNIQAWLPLGLIDVISLQSKGLFMSLIQHHNLKASILWHSAFFMVQFSHLYITTGKTIALTWLHKTFVKKCKDRNRHTSPSPLICFLP